MRQSVNNNNERLTSCISNSGLGSKLSRFLLYNRVHILESNKCF